MYVSKELALILKEKGWICGSDKDWYINIPEHKVISWIFSQHFFTEGWIPSYSNPDNSGCEQVTEPDFKTYNEWYEFWYTTLLEHKFSLMYEFISRLEDYFLLSNFHVTAYPSHEKWAFGVYDIFNSKYVSSSFEFKDNYKLFNSKQQAKHEAILKAFEILKNILN